MASDRPVLSEEEIEVTPEMIEAGLPHLYRYHPEHGVDDEETVIRVYRAMAFRCDEAARSGLAEG